MVAGNLLDFDWTAGIMLFWLLASLFFIFFYFRPDVQKIRMMVSTMSGAALLATSIVGLAGGALAAGKIKLAQTSTVTICMMNCNSAYALCQSSCVNPNQTLNMLNQGTFSAGAVAGSGSCVSLCTTQQLTCQTTCARTSPSP